MSHFQCYSPAHSGGILVVVLGYLLASGDVNCVFAALHSQHCPACATGSPAQSASADFPSHPWEFLLCRDDLLELLSGQDSPELVSSVQRMELRLWRTLHPVLHSVAVQVLLHIFRDLLCVDPSPDPAQLWGLRCGQV